MMERSPARDKGGGCFNPAPAGHLAGPISFWAK